MHFTSQPYWLKKLLERSFFFLKFPLKKRQPMENFEEKRHSQTGFFSQYG
jgi:hypothetical protein